MQYKFQIGDFISEEEGFQITDEHGVVRATAEDEPLANEIIQACNSHDELVRVAKEAAVMLGEIAATLGRSNQQTLLNSPGFQKLINAINEAEGK